MIKARMTVQIMGNHRQAIKDALKKTMSFVEERRGVKVLSEEHAEPEKMKELPLLSAFVEFEAEFNDYETFMGAIMDFGPTAVEVIKPEKMEVSIEEMQNTASDMVEKFKQANQRIQQLEAVLSARLKKEKQTE